MQSASDVEMEQSVLQDSSQLVQSTDDVEFEQSAVPDPAQLMQSASDVEIEQSVLQDSSQLVQSTDDVEFEQSAVPDPAQLMQSKDVETEQLAAEPLEPKLFYGSRRRQKCKVTIKDCDMRKSAQPRARKKTSSLLQLNSEQLGLP